MKAIRLLAAPLAGLAMSMLVAMLPGQASAYTDQRLMDDAVFDNVGTMNEAQIQSFLQTVGSSCLVNYKDVEPTWTGTQWTYTGSVPASKIIYKVAQQWGINPQVIIATLQKEQSLITGTCSSSTRYNSAMGYDCPDSGTLHDYPEIGVTGTCVSHQKYVGFTKQVLWGSWQLKFSKERAYGNVAWDGDGDITYVGFMTQGTFKRCGACAMNYYSGNATIDGKGLYLENGTTAALYTYTPHLGQSFPGIFEKWFGITYQYKYGKPASRTSNANIACTVPYFDNSKVARLYNPDIEDYIYTTDINEACYIRKYGYIYDGIVMTSATGNSAVPIYRLANSVRHLYTTDAGIRDDYANNRGYHSEGTAFMVYATQQPNSIPAYWLQRNLTPLITSSGGEKTYFQQTLDFDNAGIAFFTPDMDSAATVYRYYGPSDRVYTNSAVEAQALGAAGYMNETTGFSGRNGPGETTMPVYRLRGTGGHFYTRDRVERDVAVVWYGYVSEGTGFYSPVSTAPSAKTVVRLTQKSTGQRVYTVNEAEKTAAVNNYGYTLEGTAFYAY